MPIGPSGRIVIEVDPQLKQDLYNTLNNKGLNLKEWFLQNAEVYLREGMTENQNNSLYKDVNK